MTIANSSVAKVMQFVILHSMPFRLADEPEIGEDCFSFALAHKQQWRPCRQRVCRDI